MSSKLLHIDNRLIRDLDESKLYMSSDGTGQQIDLSNKNWFTITYKLHQDIVNETSLQNLPVVSTVNDIPTEIYIIPEHQDVNFGLINSINLSQENVVETYDNDDGILLRYVNIGNLINNWSNFPEYLTFTVAFDNDIITSNELVSLFGGYCNMYDGLLSEHEEYFATPQSYLEQFDNTIFEYIKPYSINFRNFKYKSYDTINISDVTYHSNIFQFTGNQFLSYIQLGKVFDIYGRFNMSKYFANIGILNESGCYINWYHDEYGNRFWLDYNTVSEYDFMFGNSRINPEFYNQFSQHYYQTHYNDLTDQLYYELDKIYLANARLYNDGLTIEDDVFGLPFGYSRDARWDEYAAETIDGYNSSNLDNKSLHFIDQQDEYGIYVHGGFWDNNIHILSGNYYGGWSESITFYRYLQYATGFDLSNGNTMGNIFFRPGQINKIYDLSYALSYSTVEHFNMTVDKNSLFDNNSYLCIDDPQYYTFIGCGNYMLEGVHNESLNLWITSNIYFNYNYAENYESMFDPYNGNIDHFSLQMYNTYFYDDEKNISSLIESHPPCRDYDGYGELIINPDITETGFETELSKISNYYSFDHYHSYGGDSATAYWRQSFENKGWTILSCDAVFY